MHKNTASDLIQLKAKVTFQLGYWATEVLVSLYSPTETIGQLKSRDNGRKGLFVCLLAFGFGFCCQPGQQLVQEELLQNNWRLGVDYPLHPFPKDAVTWTPASPNPPSPKSGPTVSVCMSQPIGAEFRQKSLHDSGSNYQATVRRACSKFLSSFSGDNKVQLTGYLSKALNKKINQLKKRVSFDGCQVWTFSF